MQKGLEKQIKMCLQSMAKYVSKSEWQGREREVVSLFAFGFLAPSCRPTRVLHHPGQIGLDVAVQQIDGDRRKKLVCKDIVLWDKRYKTCWDIKGEITNNPIAIIEWKARTDVISKYDEEWLKQYSRDRDDFIGFAVSFNPNGLHTKVVARTIFKGKSKKLL
jgi:hypothetical protein